MNTLVTSRCWYDKPHERNCTGVGPFTEISLDDDIVEALLSRSGAFRTVVRLK